MFTALGFTLTVFAIVLGRGELSLAVGFAVVFALWVNLHGGFLAGLGFLLLWGSCTYRPSKTWKKILPPVLLSFIGDLAHPIWGGAAGFPVTYGHNPSSRDYGMGPDHHPIPIGHGLPGVWQGLPWGSVCQQPRLGGCAACYLDWLRSYPGSPTSRSVVCNCCTFAGGRRSCVPGACPDTHGRAETCPDKTIGGDMLSAGACCC